MSALILKFVQHNRDYDEVRTEHNDWQCCTAASGDSGSRGRTHDVSSSSSLHSLEITTISHHLNCLMGGIMSKLVHEDPMLYRG